MPKKLNELEQMLETKYEPVRSHRWIFEHPCVPSYMLKSFDFGSMTESENYEFGCTIYYPESLDVNKLFSFLNMAEPANIRFLGATGQVVGKINFENCCLTSVSISTLDYADDEPLEIYLTFKYDKFNILSNLQC